MAMPMMMLAHSIYWSLVQSRPARLQWHFQLENDEYSMGGNGTTMYSSIL